MTPKHVNVIRPQSVKVREGSVKGNVKGFSKVGKSSQSVKVREGNVKGHVKLFEICDFVAIREGP